MRYLPLVVLFFCSFIYASDKEDILLLDGNWSCPVDNDFDGVKLKGNSSDKYNSKDMTYTSESDINFAIGEGSPFAKIKIIDSGKWEYKNSSFKYVMSSIEIELIFDQLGIITDDVLSQMKEGMLTDQQSFMTKSLNKSTWVTFDPQTEETSECKKV